MVALNYGININIKASMKKFVKYPESIYLGYALTVHAAFR